MLAQVMRKQRMDPTNRRKSRTPLCAPRMASEPEEEVLGLGRERPLLVSVKPLHHRESTQAAQGPFWKSIRQEMRAVPSLKGWKQS